MTKTVEEVEKFIELRARGLSFQKIAEELQVSKPTLLKWEREQEGRLSEARGVQLQAILEKYNVMRLARSEAFSSLLSSTLQEIQKRGESLGELSTEKLVSLALTLEGRVQKEAELHLRSPLEEALWSEGGSDIKVD